MYSIKWSTTSQDVYFEIIEELSSRWGTHIAFELDVKVIELLDILERHQYFCPPSIISPLLRKCTINKYISLVYRVDEKGKEIELVTFLDNRMNNDF